MSKGSAIISILIAFVAGLAIGNLISGTSGSGEETLADIGPDTNVGAARLVGEEADVERLRATVPEKAFSQELLSIRALELFIAFSMCALAIFKLRDLRSFSNQFITYDLLGRRWVRYAYIYPFAEAFAGVGMIAGVAAPLVASVALTIGGIGAVSVIKAVYVDERELKCACVGGDSNVPLGVISLTENLMMVAMAIWMFVSM